MYSSVAIRTLVAPCKARAGPCLILRTISAARRAYASSEVQPATPSNRPDHALHTLKSSILCGKKTHIYRLSSAIVCALYLACHISGQVQFIVIKSAMDGHVQLKPVIAGKNSNRSVPGKPLTAISPIFVHFCGVFPFFRGIFEDKIFLQL